MKTHRHLAQLELEKQIYSKHLGQQQYMKVQQILQRILPLE